MIKTDINEPSIDLITNLINAHETQKYKKLYDYYKGQHDILKRDVYDKTQPNNKLVNDFPGYITDISIGYFMGKPVTYSSLDDVLMQDLHDIFTYTDESDHNIQLAKTASIKGKAFEIIYVDEDSRPRFGIIEPDNTILAYSTDIAPEPIFAIRYYTEKDLINQDKVNTFAEFYNDDMIFYYEKVNQGAFKLIGQEQHFFNGVPIVEYPNNDERLGDFEKVLSLIDAYNLLQSNSTNISEYNDEAFLKIINMSGSTIEDINEMKRNRFVLVDGDGDVEWITKNQNDTSIENQKNRIVDDIHKFSKTPNLTDESFAGNVSGVALEFKLWGLEQGAVQKERKFKKGLQRRLELLFNFLFVKGKDYDWRDVNITFTRNIPINNAEIVDMVIKLRGILSDKTTLAMLPFVDDIQTELELLEQEKETRISLDDDLDDDIDNDNNELLGDDNEFTEDQ